MSSFNMKMRRTRKHNADGSIIYNTMNSSGLEYKYKNKNARFDSNHTKVGTTKDKCGCSIAGCGKQCCFNYFLIENISQTVWENSGNFNKGKNIIPGTKLYGSATPTSEKKELGIIEDYFFPFSNSCIPLDGCDCSGNFPLSVRIVVRSTGNSCVINLSQIQKLYFGTTASVENSGLLKIVREKYEVLGTSNKGKPYRAPIAGYRKELVCCGPETVLSCIEYCLIQFQVDDVVGSIKVGDRVYLTDGTFYGYVYTVQISNNPQIKSTFTIKFKLGECNDKLKDFLRYQDQQTKKVKFYKENGTLYQTIEKAGIIQEFKECKTVTNDVYKDPYVESCSKPGVCYDKRIRSGMQPKKQLACKNNNNKKCEKKYSFSYSQYNKNRVMNTYERGLEKNRMWDPKTKKFLKCQKLFHKSSGDACLANNKFCNIDKNPEARRLPKTALTVWNPSNKKFKVQGAVSAGSRLERLKLDTIKSANSKCAKGARCDTIDCEKVPNGVYFAGKPRFNGWMYNARHRERVWPNSNMSYIRNRPLPLGIPQTSSSSCISVRSNAGPTFWNKKPAGVRSVYQRNFPGQKSTARNLRVPGYGPVCEANCKPKCTSDSANYQTQINDYVGADNARYQGNIKCN